MSALHPDVEASKVVYIYDAATGVGESKGGVTWAVGNDTTGDGRAEAPYATIDQANQEVKTSEGATTATANWEFRFVTDDDEASTYTGVDANSGSYIANDPVNGHFRYRGWLKAWGDKVSGDIGDLWVSQSEKPQLGPMIWSATTKNGWNRVIYKDLIRNNGSISEDHFNNTSAGEAADPFMQNAKGRNFGCSHIGGGLGSGNMQFNNKGGVHTIGDGAGYLACSFEDCTMDANKPSNGGSVSSNTSYGLLNCYIHNTTKNFTKLQSSTSRLTKIANTIFNMDGIGIRVWDSPSSATDTEDTQVRDNNRYFFRNGAKYAKWSSALAEEANLSPSPINNYDGLSSEGDPLLISDSDPTLQDSSPVLDKGGALNVTNQSVDDFGGNNWHNFDALNNPWGDDQADTNISTNMPDSSFTHRGVGPIQNPLGFVTADTVLTWPLGIISSSTIYVASEVPIDPDLTGTCQFRVTQGDDAAFSSGVVIKDSAPLHVTALNNKIDFKEDGGAEQTATLTIATYTTAELLTEIKTQLEAVGAGTYDVTFDSGTEKVTIAPTAGITNVQILFGTGTNNANAANENLGYRGDTANATSVEAEDETLENFFDATLDYEFSADHTSGEDPATDGIWNDVGTGLPSNSGVEGTDGVKCDLVGKHVRCDLGNASDLSNKYHSIQFWTGNNRSNNEAV